MYALSLEGALITHYLFEKPMKEVANKSTCGGKSTDKGHFVVYLRVAKPAERHVESRPREKGVACKRSSREDSEDCTAKQNLMPKFNEQNED